MGRKSKQQEKIEALITSLSKEMMENPVVQVSLFYLLIVGIRKSLEAMQQLDPEAPSPEPTPGQIFLESYWRTVWQKFFGPFASNVPTPEIPTTINEFYILELAILAAIPLSAGGGLTSSLKDIVNVLT